MLNLPTFPKTKKLEIGDRLHIQNFVKQFPPYSDYNFTSLFSWNTDNAIEISELNGNLVVKFSDYMTSKPFWSFIGQHKLDTTAETILEHSKGHESHLLKLIPAAVADQLDSRFLKVEEDRDQFDYVISIEDQASMTGEKNHPKRRRIKKLLNSGVEINDIALGKLHDHDIRSDLERVFNKWVKVKVERGVDIRESDNESKALHRLMLNKSLDAELFSITIEGDMVAFFIGEQLSDDYFMGHFEKADPTIEGLYQYLKHTVALNLLARGVKFMNIEQDLGIEGLRNAKIGRHPIHFLKKFTVRLERI